MKETLQTWWQQLAPRERLVIGWGAAGLLLALLYAYLWQPLDSERNRLRAALPALRVAAEEVRAGAEEASRLKASAAPATTGTALQAAVQQAASESGSAQAPQLSLLDESRVSANWSAISFEAWTAMTAKLQNARHIRLESVTVDALPEPGLVRVQAVFASGG